ncbi:MAG: TIGR03013 family XrtA/PEP-CTERM system glycosyltransferase [Burkholderiaceae bacterium]
MRTLAHYLSARSFLLPVLEAALLSLSMVVAFEWRDDQWSLVQPLIYGLVFAGLMQTAMSGFGLYDEREQRFRLTMQRVLSAYLVTLAVAAVLFYLFADVMVRRGVFAVASMVALLGVLAVRYMAHRAAAMQVPTRRVLVLGDGPEAGEIAEMLRVARSGRAPRFAAQVSPQSLGDDDGPLNERKVEPLAATVRERRVSEIVVALRERRGGREPLTDLLRCRLMGVQVIDAATFYERELGLIALDHLRSSWLVYGEGFDQGWLRAFVKRAFDVITSFVLLLLASPAVLVVAVAVRLESSGPVLYRQVRVGAGGRPFSMLKFRSMRTDAEVDGKPQWAAVGDARITRVGRIIRRLRLDEVPQLINVLRGEMSFVGPRPERPYFVERLVEQIPYYELRHNLKPGITGWAQVRQEYGASVEDARKKLQYDLDYVKNHSRFLDLTILVETVQVVLTGKGAR